MSYTQGPSPISAVDLFLKGRKIQADAKAEAEKDKIGVLRAGTSGCLVGETVIGKCHRLALARFIGLDEPKSNGTYCIFESGEANEEVWMKKMVLAWEGEVTGDTKYPLKWEIDGTTVTGRPDLVFLDPNGVAVGGVELKVVESANSAARLFYQQEPSTDNLCQAAHYSLKLGLPFTLLYTYSGKADVPYWLIKKGLAPARAKLEPFKLEFKLFWQDGALSFIRPNGEVVATKITAAGIEDYYRIIPQMRDQKDLYLRFSSQDYKMEKLGFDACAYCSLNDICSEYEGHGNYELWRDEVELKWSKKI